MVYIQEIQAPKYGERKDGEQEGQPTTQRERSIKKHLRAYSIIKTFGSTNLCPDCSQFPLCDGDKQGKQSGKKTTDQTNNHPSEGPRHSSGCDNIKPTAELVLLFSELIGQTLGCKDKPRSHREKDASLAKSEKYPYYGEVQTCCKEHKSRSAEELTQCPQGKTKGNNTSNVHKGGGTKTSNVQKCGGTNTSNANKGISTNTSNVKKRISTNKPNACTGDDNNTSKVHESGSINTSNTHKGERSNISSAQKDGINRETKNVNVSKTKNEHTHEDHQDNVITTNSDWTDNKEEVIFIKDNETNKSRNNSSALRKKRTSKDKCKLITETEKSKKVDSSLKCSKIINENEDENEDTNTISSQVPNKVDSLSTCKQKIHAKHKKKLVNAKSKSRGSQLSLNSLLNHFKGKKKHKKQAVLSTTKDNKSTELEAEKQHARVKKAAQGKEMENAIVLLNDESEIMKRSASRNNSAKKKDNYEDAFKPWSKYRDVKVKEKKDQVMSELTEKLNSRKKKVDGVASPKRKKHGVKQANSPATAYNINTSANKRVNFQPQNPGRLAQTNINKFQGQNLDKTTMNFQQNSPAKIAQPKSHAFPNQSLGDRIVNYGQNNTAGLAQPKMNTFNNQRPPVYLNQQPNRSPNGSPPIQNGPPRSPNFNTQSTNKPNFPQNMVQFGEGLVTNRPPVTIVRRPGDQDRHPLDNIHTKIHHTSPNNPPTPRKRSIDELATLIDKLKEPPKKQVKPIDSTELMRHFQKVTQGRPSAQHMKHKSLMKGKRGNSPIANSGRKPDKKSPKNVKDIVRFFDPAGKDRSSSAKKDSSVKKANQMQLVDAHNQSAKIKSPHAQLPTGRLNVSGSASTSPQRGSIPKKKKKKKKGKKSKGGKSKGGSKGGKSKGGSEGGKSKGDKKVKSKKGSNANPRKGMQGQGPPRKRSGGKRGSRGKDGKRGECCKKRRPCRPCPDTVQVLSDLQGLKERVSGLAAKASPQVSRRQAKIVPAEECGQSCRSSGCCRNSRCGFARCGSCRSNVNESNSSENQSATHGDGGDGGSGTCGRCCKSFQYNGGVDDDGHLTPYVYDLCVALCGRRIEEAMIRVIPAARDRMLDICTGCGKPYFTGRCCPQRAPGQCCCNGGSGPPCGDCEAPAPCFDPKPPCCCDPCCPPSNGCGGCGAMGGYGGGYGGGGGGGVGLPTMGYPRLLSNPGDFARERVFQALQGKIQKILYKNMCRG